MSAGQNITPTGREVFFDRKDLIVSKTDLKGHITYANDIFLEIAGYEEDEVIGMPHSLIRHPDMPRSVFKLLWDHVQAGDEIFAYVFNLTRTGDHYWVIAHVTPSRDMSGKIVGYHSTRRVANPEVLRKTIIPLYDKLRELEQSEANSKTGLAKAYAHLTKVLDDAGLEYAEFIASLNKAA